MVNCHCVFLLTGFRDWTIYLFISGVSYNCDYYFVFVWGYLFLVLWTVDVILI